VAVAARYQRQLIEGLHATERWETLPASGCELACLDAQEVVVTLEEAIHRDYAQAAGSVGVALYDDRLEIISPGELHFGLTPEALFQPPDSRPWNPWIAKVFHRRGLIETWGRGTLKMAALMQAAGLQRMAPPRAVISRCY
jgi:ATP-dependent DNA helicase RecG